MTVPEARQRPRLRNFALKRHRLPVAGGTLSVVAPRSMDALLDAERVRRFERTGELPYWAEIWPASVALARRLRRGPSLAGQRVLDLGCGIGVAGIGAASAGASVTFADRDPDALAFAEYNARSNGARDVAVLQLDWNHGTAPGGFDRLLLADVAYDERHDQPLLRHVECCLVAGGHALLADPFRKTADAFLARVGRHFPVEMELGDVWFGGRRIPVRIAVIRR
jgi:predicted nicotinamide N-methyase